MKRMIFSLVLTFTLFSSQSAVAWNGTGHKLVARIAWDDMTPTTRKNVIALLMKIPNNASLRERFSKNTSRPLEEREREFFTVAATWPDEMRLLSFAGKCIGSSFRQTIFSRPGCAQRNLLPGTKLPEALPT